MDNNQEQREKEGAKVLTNGEGTELDSVRLTRLGQHLAKRFSRHKTDRRSQEQQWLRNLYQFLGKYDAETDKGIPPDRSRAYPKITRTKVVVIVARLMNLLFPQSDKNWDLRASKVPSLTQDELNAAFGEWRDENPEAEVTQEELDRLVRAFASKAAKELERHVSDQLQDAMGSPTETDSSDFVTLCRRVILSAAVFNVGVLKGPLTLSVEKSVISIEPGATTPTVGSIDTYRPYFDAVDVWNYYPDLQAKTFADMEGEFEDHLYTRIQLEALGDRPDFIKAAVSDFVNAHPEGNYTANSYENELDALASAGKKANTSSRYRVQEFWGVVTKAYIKDLGLEIPEGMEDKENYRITAWIGGRHILKVELNPLPLNTNIYHKFVFDDSMPNLLGGSMCEIMRDSQMAVAASARMLIDNASVTCGPNLEIDLSKLVPNQDVRAIGPFRNYYTDNKNNPSGHRAVNNVSIDSHMSELMSVMDTFLSFADMETFVGGYGEADNTPSEALRTSAGASMVLGNAALPFRDIVRSFDTFTVSVLRALIEWNRIFNDELEYVGDIRPVAKGATSMIAKELHAYALDNLAETLSPEELMYIDTEKLLAQRLMSRDIPFDDIKASEEEVNRRKKQRAEEAQRQAEQADQLFEAELREKTTDAHKNLAQAKKHLDSADATSVQAIAKITDVGAAPRGNTPT